jgi:hypothetical protein
VYSDLFTTYVGEDNSVFAIKEFIFSSDNYDIGTVRDVEYCLFVYCDLDLMALLFCIHYNKSFRNIMKNCTINDTLD